MRRYIAITSDLRGTQTHLFISYVKPHKRVSSDTISRWIKYTLSRAGVDITRFKAHSTRSAAAAAAKQGGATTDEILKCVGWSNARTFAQFYDREIVEGRSLGDFIRS